jgi:hypothetical protein
VVITAQPSSPTAPTVGTITQPTCAVASGSVVLNGLPATGTWTLNPGNISGNGTGYTISNLSSGTYTYTVTNSSGCISPASANVVITAQPSSPTAPTVGTITQPTCALATGSVVLSGLPASGSWTLIRTPGGTTTTGTGTSSTISSLSAGTYSYTVTNASGCVSPASANVVITAQPSSPTAPTVGTITQPTCALATGSIVLNGLPASGTWTLNPGNISGNGTSYTISNLSAGTYTYTVTNASGCVSLVSTSVVINSQPETPDTPKISSVIQPTCSLATGTVVLSNLPSSGIWTLTRTPGSATTGTGSSYSLSSLASGNYTFAVINPAGCISNSSEIVVITSPPSAPIPPVIGAIIQPSSAYPKGSVVLEGLPASGSWIINPGNISGNGTSYTISDLTKGTYRYTVTNTSGCISSESSAININGLPLSDAGIDQSVFELSAVFLDGTGSSDPDNDALTYLWTAPSGIVLSSNTISKPSFTAPEVTLNTDLIFSLIVNDGDVNSLTDEVVVTIKQRNKVPAANAGDNQIVSESSVVLLDGSGSSDPDNDALTYLWTAPSGIILSSATSINPSFTAPDVISSTNYIFSLVVNDGLLNSSSDEVVVTVKQSNQIPTANAGSDQLVNEGVVVNLDGGLSIDPDGDQIIYHWEVPTEITLINPNTVSPSFLTPTVTSDTDFSIKLSVNDGNLESIQDEVIIRVLKNQIPIANAGGNQSIYQKSLVTLDGSASIDPNNKEIFYHWTAPSGIHLNSETTSTPNFTAPEVNSSTQFIFKLIVNNGYYYSTPDFVTVTVKKDNTAPVSNAGSDQFVNEGTLAILDGSSSVDPDDDQLFYNWTAPPGILLSSTTVAKPSFVVPGVEYDENYSFKLVVFDGANYSSTDEVVITIKQVNKPPIANAGPDQIVTEGSFVSLNGSLSSDSDGNLISYKWTAPTGIILSSTSTPNPSFVAPEVYDDTDFIFSLVVNDGKDNSIADQVIVKVSQVNKAPLANAGPNESVAENGKFMLDGSKSTDPDNDALNYQWTAPDGIILSSLTIPNPTFVAPEVNSDTYYTFSLVVNDGKLNSQVDKIIVKVEQINKMPVANSGSDQTFYQAGLVTLNGLGSFDPDLDAISYHWMAPEGIILSSNTSSKPTFTLPEVTYSSAYTFSLVVNDGRENSIADQVVISLLNENIDRSPYVKDSIDDISVDKRSPAQIVDLNTVFADDDPGDILKYTVTQNTNGNVVQANISGSNLNLSFSSENIGLSEITITAESNGKKIQSEFSVEVKSPTAIYPEYEVSVVKIFPNPTRGHVQINFNKTPEVNSWISVFDVSGKLISKIKAEDSEQSLNLEGNLPGMYFIKIDQQVSKSYKLILE